MVTISGISPTPPSIPGIFNSGCGSDFFASVGRCAFALFSLHFTVFSLSEGNSKPPFLSFFLAGLSWVPLGSPALPWAPWAPEFSITISYYISYSKNRFSVNLPGGVLCGAPGRSWALLRSPGFSWSVRSPGLSWAFQAVVKPV